MKTWLVASLLLAACGGGGSTAPTPCTGCIAAGVCRTGTEASACGIGGGACTACGGAQSCSAGACGGTSRIAEKCTADPDCGPSELCASDVPGGGYCTASCAASSCPSGSACVDLGGGTKLCLKSCTGAGCRSEQLCLSNVCLPKCARDIDCASANCDLASGLCGPSRVGNVCGADPDCGQKPAFCDTSAQGGYCSLPCGGNQNDPCPAGSTCASVGSGASVCFVGCGGGSTCRAGELCANLGGGVQACVPKCGSNLDCGGTLRCDVPSGQCVSGGPPPGELGGACTADGDCGDVATGVFCGQGYPGGYCSRDCAGNAAACGANGVCVDFTSSAGSEFDCLDTCQTRADCRPEYVCYPLTGASVCLPACGSNQNCPAGQACDPTSGFCVTPSAGSTTTVQSVPLTPGGPIPVPTDRLTATLTFTVPTDAISVTLIGQATDVTARIVVYRIETPDGRIYDYASTGSIMRVLPPTGPGAFAVLAPNSPNVPFTPGSWTITLLASKATSATAQMLVKRTSSLPLVAGKVDLNLFFVGAPHLNAGLAQTDPGFKAIFDQVKATWAQIGVSIGTVTWLDLAPVDVGRFQDLKDSDLGALMQKSAMAGANDNALNVFFVRTISGGTLDGYIILGESAGIPGVPILGTSGSGMAVTMADFPQGLADIADTWVHEGSHFLGLFHTTESGGAAFDPLPDTPECPVATYDANADRIMTPAECASQGADNEMFWTSSTSVPAHSRLTPNQEFVLLRNPAVH